MMKNRAQKAGRLNAPSGNLDNKWIVFHGLVWRELDRSVGERIGTIQSFKGLEADVVILCGIDGKLPGCSPANRYVGATRARVMLHVIKQREVRV
jgi:superfamily I DNA/RNA helicase